MTNDQWPMTDDKFPGRQSDPVYLSFVIGHLSFRVRGGPRVLGSPLRVFPSAPPLLCPFAPLPLVLCPLTLCPLTPKVVR